MISIAKEYSSHDTVEALRMLLKIAESGDLRGLYFVGYMKRRRQLWGATGIAYDDPTTSLGPAILPAMEMILRAMGKNNGD